MNADEVEVWFAKFQGGALSFGCLPAKRTTKLVRCTSGHFGPLGDYRSQMDVRVWVERHSSKAAAITALVRDLRSALDRAERDVQRLREQINSVESVTL